MFRSVPGAADGLVDDAWGGDDHVVAEHADAGGAAVLAPHVGVDGFADEFEEFLGAFGLGGPFVFLVLPGARASTPGSAAEQPALPATSATALSAAALALLLKAEVGGVGEVRDVHEEVGHVV